LREACYRLMRQITSRPNAEVLAAMPVWLFPSEPTGEGDSLELLQAWKLPEELLPAVERIRLRRMADFYRHINLSKIDFIEKQLLKEIKKPTSDDRN
jgi:hypothetical protein